MKRSANSGKRIFAYDFVRIFACAGVFLFHLDQGAAEYFPDVPIPHLPGWTGFLFVTAFFMLSGCMMQLRYGSRPAHNTGSVSPTSGVSSPNPAPGVSSQNSASGGAAPAHNSFSLREYYTKRFLGIFPAFYAVFVPLWILSAIRHGSLFFRGPKWTILLSVLGVDGYFSAAFSTYYMIGEWFLGALILLYLLYPLLRIGMEKAGVALMAGSVILFLLTADQTLLAVSPLANFPSCLVSFVAGMAFERYVRHKAASQNVEAQHFTVQKTASQHGVAQNCAAQKAAAQKAVSQQAAARASLLRTCAALCLLCGGALCLCIGLRRSVGAYVSLSIVFHLAGALVFLLLFLVGSWIDDGKNLISAGAIDGFIRLSGGTYEFYLVHHWLIDKILRTAAARSTGMAMLAAASVAALALSLLAAALLRKIIRFAGTRTSR